MKFETARSRRDVLKIGLALGAVPLLGACGDDAGAAGEGGRIAWRSGTISPTIPDGFTLMCDKKGYLSEAGLDVEFTSANGAELVRAAVGSRLDVILLAPGTGFAANENGADLKLVGVPWNKVRDFIFAKKEIADPADLAGKRIAIQAPNTSSAILVNAVLEQYQIDPGQVSIVQSGGDSERMAALLSGQVDAALGGVENIPIIDRDPKLHRLVSLADIVPDVLGSGWFATAGIIEERPDDLTKVLTAYTKGMRYALDHLDEATALAMERLKSAAEDEPDVAEAIKAHRDLKIINPDLGWTDKQVEATQELNVAIQAQKAVIPAADVTDTSFVDKVIAELKTYSW
ncbi:ABC transporter substrate-binding protein [Actinophytocola sp.]|uniref:ABC transporter substrate-binding protein n=1 Tax=Actinophytocola sp. TaxID=1872138 RepID=UPI003D6A57E1